MLAQLIISALMFHAGGFVLGSTDMIPKSQIASLVNKGFVVVTPEYRLCPQVSLYDGPIQDAKDVLKWCQEDLPKLMSEKGIEVDGKRVVAMGHSAGGQLALTTVYCSSTIRPHCITNIGLGPLPQSTTRNRRFLRLQILLGPRVEQASTHLLPDPRTARRLHLADLFWPAGAHFRPYVHRRQAQSL